ncbi:MAG TPA: phage tail protein [Croceibacterium sp.]
MIPLRLPEASDLRTPLGNFAFHVAFDTEKKVVPAEPFGAFSEISGLEATMEHKVIKEGGRNYGPVLRVGQVSFATVILKRGFVEIDNLWNWWALFTGADGESNPYPLPTNRCDVLIGLIGLKPFSPEPEKPKEGEYHYKDTKDTPFGKMNVQVDAYNTFGRKPAEPPKPIDPIPEIRAVWRLRNAMPVKFRAGDLNAKGNDIAVEELHLVHEGLALEKPST